MIKIANYIGGELREPVGGHYLENPEPATGQIYALVPDSDEKDLDLAVEAASRAFPAWSGLPAQKRSRFLRAISDLIQKNWDELAQAESRDTGKPIKLAKDLDIPRSAQNFDFFADSITQFTSEFHQTQKGVINYTLRDPLGVVGCISPWNLPLYLLTWKIAPALAAGNTVVAKPSEVTPMTAFLLSKIAQEAGLPPGVLNIVHGLGKKVGQNLILHPDVKAISFTGSTATGQEIARLSAPFFKKVSLEMGGKNPNIIFADCDFDHTVAQTVRAAFLNQGQICLCGSRIYVERPIYDRFKKSFIEMVRALKMGDPQDQSTDQGALVSRPHYEKILSYLELALSEGGKVLVGGKAAQLSGRCQKGWFVEPTVIEGLPSQCRTNQEEIFGPVATLIPFENEGDMLKEVNSTRYGLAASLWTTNLDRAHRVAERIQSGIVWVNCWMLRDLRTPFGGFKDSGLGREGGWEALRFFTEPKNVCISFGSEESAKR